VVRQCVCDLEKLVNEEALVQWGGAVAPKQTKKSKPISQTRGGAAPGPEEGQLPDKARVTRCVVCVLILVFVFPLLSIDVKCG